jgi:hypothetical protein
VSDSSTPGCSRRREITKGWLNVATAEEAGEGDLVLEKVHVLRPGRGRPRCRPVGVLADKAYSSRGNRGYLRRRGIRATIPEKADQLAARQRRG